LFNSFEGYWRYAKDLIDRALKSEVDKMHFSRYLAHSIAGGKRFRGTLTLLMAQSLGGSVDDALPFGVAVELVHQGTLIHDDFLDRHETRRNRVPLYKLLDPRRAFLLADMLLSIAQWKLTGSKDGYKTLAKAIYETCHGACMEPLNPRAFLKSLQRGGMREVAYFTLVRLKTAGLFGAACKLGSLVSDPSMAHHAYRYGIRVGTAYQLADDLCDYLIARREGKIELPIATKLIPFLFHFAPSILPKLILLFPDGKLERVEKELDKADIVRKSEREMKRQIDMAKKAVETFPQNAYTNLLTEAPSFLAQKLLEESA
jgi:geranylgeranyl pyrophosphate synthase